MTRAFKLPDLGEGVHEGEVLAVHVSVGQEVKEGDIILEVETDKAAVEIPSPFSGMVAEIRVKAGDTVKVGDVMMTFGNGEAAEAVEEKKAEEVPSKTDEPGKAVSAPQAGKRKGPVPASPSTRRLARELGVDLRRVPPTGSGGLVTADDVRAFADRGKDEVEAPATGEDMPAEAPTVSIPSPTLPDFTKWGPVERRFAPCAGQPPNR